MPEWSCLQEMTAPGSKVTHQRAITDLIAGATCRLSQLGYSASPQGQVLQGRYCTGYPCLTAQDPPFQDVQVTVSLHTKLKHTPEWALGPLRRRGSPEVFKLMDLKDHSHPAIRELLALLCRRGNSLREVELEWSPCPWPLPKSFIAVEP